MATVLAAIPHATIASTEVGVAGSELITISSPQMTWLPRHLPFFIVPIPGATVENTEATSWNLNVEVLLADVSTCVDDLGNHLLRTGKLDFNTTATICRVS